MVNDLFKMIVELPQINWGYISNLKKAAFAWSVLSQLTLVEVSFLFLLIGLAIGSGDRRRVDVFTGTCFSGAWKCREGISCLQCHCFLASSLKDKFNCAKGVSSSCFFDPILATFSIARRCQKLMLEILLGKDATWFRMTIASHSFTVDVGIFSFLNGTFVPFEKTNRRIRSAWAIRSCPWF